MKTTTPGILAALVAMSLGAATPAAAGGLPVIDIASVQQETISAIEGVNQTLKMVQQYQLQLQQYENMIQNTLAPAAYVWNQVERVNMAILGATNTLNYYRNQAGNLDGYLYKYQNSSYYMSSPCFSISGCPESERNRLFENRRMASDAQKRANDAMIRGLDLQQQELEADGRRLTALQMQAQGAQGQMQAIQAANQLASNQASQLMTIRALLMAQQNAEAARQAALADIEAQQHAASVQMREGAFKKSVPYEW
ncbi:P-type conjugative transfer protein TrbJ [Nitrosospira sp. Nsp18]|uniref:P-type conjugative transfer protein TrbJ n=1 Tax=Nitrosospira sp. Nsp18 TaxID=1855334 RepID=UPI0008812E46|nr:P-type conjugative transfer protein TrbJ [Nitrosospira sp. Nsp18]SDA23361.1 P-type conjugative transfer protein TrbJ [Nitrosospira sp. Nsp18]